jgi:hypothetical protein
MQEMSAAHAQPDTAEPAAGRGVTARAAGGPGNGNGHAADDGAASATAATPAVAAAVATPAHAAATAVSVNTGEADLANVPMAAATVTAPTVQPAPPDVPVAGSPLPRKSSDGLVARPATACARTVATGYGLVLAGSAAVPLAPEIRSTLVARCVLVGCFAALVVGAGLILWGFVRNALGRRRTAAAAKPARES